MSVVTNRPASLPPPTSEVPSHRVPTLEELYAMTSEPDHRVVIRDVDWAFYEDLVNSIREDDHIHVDYDGKDVEIVMVLSYPHDETKKLLGQFVEGVAQELAIPYKSGGQTTWKRPEVNRGLESDDCYFFRAEKLAMIAAAKARKSGKIADYPNPDLGVEVDYSPSKIDRPGIYAALRVAEVWRFNGDQVFIDRLGEDGHYHEAAGEPLPSPEGRRDPAVGGRGRQQRRIRLGSTAPRLGPGRIDSATSRVRANNGPSAPPAERPRKSSSACGLDATSANPIIILSANRAARGGDAGRIRRGNQARHDQSGRPVREVSGPRCTYPPNCSSPRASGPTARS